MERTNLRSLKQIDWCHVLATETTLACFDLWSVHIQRDDTKSLVTFPGISDYNDVSVTATLDEKNL